LELGRPVEKVDEEWGVEKGRKFGRELRGRNIYTRRGRAVLFGRAGG
jgi:hypothetical protein